MTVKKLIYVLQHLHQDSIVVMSADPEGSSFSPLADVADNKRYRDGDIGLEKLTPELEEAGYSEEDVMKGGKKCVVLWP